jgi:hypothetical protein
MSSESGDESDVLRRKMFAIGEKDGSRLLVATEWAN